MKSWNNISHRWHLFHVLSNEIKINMKFVSCLSQILFMIFMLEKVLKKILTLGNIFFWILYKSHVFDSLSFHFYISFYRMYIYIYCLEILLNSIILEEKYYNLTYSNIYIYKI